MATFDPRITVTCPFVMHLTEKEALALEAISNYSPEPVIDAIASATTPAGVKENREGLASFYIALTSLKEPLDQLRSARRIFSAPPHARMAAIMAARKEVDQHEWDHGVPPNPPKPAKPNIVG